MDLNSDLGEGFGVWRLGDDEAMLGIVTSANVACGFHAGDPSTMARVCRWAAERGVTIGAQVSYPDLPGFGRRFIDMQPDELTDAVTYQIGALDAFARAARSAVTYVKPHGALYNATVHHRAQAGAVATAVAAYGDVALMGLPGSALLCTATDAGIRIMREGFADRAYTVAGTLVDRRQPGALISDPADAARRAVAMADAGGIDSLCVHGDTPDAVAIATAVRDALAAAGHLLGPATPSS